MKPGPPKFAETAVGFLIPPACREEVLGDLHERYTGLSRYLVDAMRSAPLVILSRMRRTTEPRVFLLEALVLYLSFLSAAWYFDWRFLKNEWALFRLAIPVAVALVAVTLVDAYANPEKRSPLKAIDAVANAIVVAWVSQLVLGAGNPDWALPRWTRMGGGCMGLLLISSLRMLFPPLADRPQSANGLAYWQKQAGAPVRIPPRAILTILVFVAMLLYLLGAYQLDKTQ